MVEIANKAIKQTFGNDSKIDLFDIISDGIRNFTCKIECNKYDKPLFLKIEKRFVLPVTQKYQIKREVAGIALCKKHNINVPKMINADTECLIADYPWILEEFIEGKLISQFKLTDDNRNLLGIEFEEVFSKLTSIENSCYGDTFDNGIIGKHKSWRELLSKITMLLFADCDMINVFDDNSRQIVLEAITKALSTIVCNSKPVFFHYDLFSANVIGIQNNSEVHIAAIIDFGMSLFAPIHYVQHQTRKYTDFKIKNYDICQIYDVSQQEFNSYEILRLEPVLLLNIMKYYSDSINYVSETEQYVKRCKEFLSSPKMF